MAVGDGCVGFAGDVRCGDEEVAVSCMRDEDVSENVLFILFDRREGWGIRNTYFSFVDEVCG